VQPQVRTPAPDTAPLRRRADHLDDLARRIEDSEVMRLDTARRSDAAEELLERLLRRNVVQLAVAVAELRTTAGRLRQHANGIDDTRTDPRRITR
jgi:hypothetical protein